MTDLKIVSSHDKPPVTNSLKPAGMIDLWTVYDHPTDYPDHFVARLFEGEYPTKHHLLAEDIEQLRDEFRMKGMTCIPRSPSDDVNIVETWL